MKRRTFLSRIGQCVVAAGAIVLGVFGRRETVIETPEMSMDEARKWGRFHVDVARPLQDEIDFLQRQRRLDFRRMLVEDND